MNKLNLILAFFCIAFSCKEKVPAQSQVDIITGSLNLPVKEDIKLPVVAFSPDLDALRLPGDSQPVRMVAFGGSLAAGLQNGGLYREGQLTAIPNLIAHQMQLQSFVQPLFDKHEGNGTGYLIYDTSEQLPSWKKVTNYLGITSEKPLILSRYNGPVPVDNISWPHGPGASSDSSQAFSYYPNQKEYFSYLYRFYDKRGVYDSPFENMVDSVKNFTNLVLVFGDLDLWVGVACCSENLNANAMLNEGYFYPQRQFILENLSKKRKLVLFNQPDYLDFPFFHLYDVKRIIAKGGVSGAALQDSSLLIPTGNIKKAFFSDQIAVLTDCEVLSPEESRQLRNVNLIINRNVSKAFSEQYNLPMVDLYTLCKKILSGKYYSDDGLFINPSFPNGNFFSNDGLHPTAIGNAVIANETIKEINRVYKTKIPLINIGLLAKAI
ncbi:hypothetical protein LZD49_04760 [Dyadobacter sp. CY261]|uniref:hypothetical protein n=1 Tax=Dyadobacter sp. CY261 TaxID=2907203 RepID=UPI001F191053|nr:hypothetical protein [Dyadobacter sp. CY261]MCF0069771.1 hypothetical protein [Dyadobacter sp. CY261]